MFVLGVTGGIGSGKTTVAGLFAARGARVLDADVIVRELYEGGELPEAIAERFGADVLAPDGSVDRGALGRVVFEDPAARRDLEALVHPAVRRAVLARLARWRREGWGGLVVLDAALLVESELAYPLDALLVVVAPEERRLERLERRGVAREEALRRMRAQAGDAEKRARADHVIENTGTLEDLEREVERVLSELGGDGGTRSG